MPASVALDHPFMQLAHHRGLGDRIQIDRLRAYVLRRKLEVSFYRVLEVVCICK